MISTTKKLVPFQVKKKILSTLLHLRRKVDFAIIGFPKCATTSIARNLQDIPDLCLPSFEVQPREYIKGHVKVDKRVPLFGIKNPNLIYEQHNLAALIDRNPKIKIILCLRKPTDWLFSFYQYRKLDIQENGFWLRPYLAKDPTLKTISFDDIIYNGKDLIGVHIERGLFAEYIRFIIRYLDPSQILILFLDEIARTPKDAFKKIFRFLDLNLDYLKEEPAKANQKNNQYESKALYKEQLLYLDEYYASGNMELNLLLEQYWGINNNYW